MKAKKAVLALFLTFTLVCGMISTQAVSAFADGITVILDGNPLSFDVPPQNINGRIMVPLRVIFEAMGAVIEWDDSTQTVMAVSGDTVVVLRVGDTAPTVNGQAVIIDQPGLLVDGRTLAPLRFVAEAFGGTVVWSASERTARITTNGGFASAVPASVPQSGEVEIDLYNRGITNEKFAQMVASGEIPANVTILYLGLNQISDMSLLSGLTDLRILHLNFNRISDISALSGLTNLTELRLYGNQISDISPLNGLTNLTDLDLASNQISDISPLSGLTNLTRLELSFNQINDISPLSGLTNLAVLWLDRNQISDISPLSELVNLSLLGLSDNPITDWSPVDHVRFVYGRPQDYES